MVMLAQLDKELVVKVAVEAGACPKCALRYVLTHFIQVTINRPCIAVSI